MFPMQSFNISGQFQRVLVQPILNKRIHQLGQLQNLQQLRISSQRQRVQLPQIVNASSLVYKLLTLLLKFRNVHQQTVQFILNTAELTEQFPGTLCCLDESFVVCNCQLLGLFEHCGFFFF